MSRRVYVLLIGLACFASAKASETECGDPVPESEWSVVMPLAAESLVLDITRVGETVVAVGERGHVLVSADGGRRWVQKRAPTRTLLTGVWFHDHRLGWAVGHDAVILRTEDGGETWCRVHFAPELEFPLFDVWFADEHNGFAVGAYGYFLRSHDGGLSWHEDTLDVVSSPADSAPDPAGDKDGEDAGPAADLHINRIIHDTAGRLYLMSEAGTVFKSDDQGMTWRVLKPPYGGSFFGGVAPDDESLLIFGLRGQMFRTWDAGASWRAVRLPIDTSLFGGTRTAGGAVVVVGTAGVMLLSREGDRFRLKQRADRKALVSALGLEDGAVIVIGEPGVERLERSDLGLE